MLVYMILLSLLLSLWLFLKPKLALQISMLTAYVLCSLRYDFGNYIHYKWNFVVIQHLGLLEIIKDYESFWDILSHSNPAHAEFGYIFLNWLFSGTTFEWFVAATTGLLFMTIYYLIIRYGEEDYYWLSFLLFVNPTILFIHLSVFRQMLATCMLIWAVIAHLEVKTFWKRTLIVLVLLIMMALLHKSALLLLPLFPLLDRIKLRGLFIAYCLLWGLIPLAEPLLLNASTNLGFYDNYTTSEKITSGGNIALSMILTLIFAWLFYFGSEISDPAKRLCLIMYCFVFMTRPFNSRPSLYLFNRYELYFDLFIVIAIPAVIKQITSRFSRFVWTAVLIAFFLLRAHLFFLSPRSIGQHEFLYTSIFDKGIVIEQNWIKGYEFDD